MTQAWPAPSWEPGPGQYAHLTASGLVKTGPGVLVGVVIGTQANATITLYDSTTASGQVISVLNSATADAPGLCTFGCYFTNGLYAAISAAIDATVIFR